MVKIKKPLLLAIVPIKAVKKDFSVSLIFISLSFAKVFNSEGKRRKVTSKEIIKPSVIIHPKSMIGLISLNINDKNAQTVVRTV